MTPWSLPCSKFLNKSVNKQCTGGPGTRNKCQKNHLLPWARGVNVVAHIPHAHPRTPRRSPEPAVGDVGVRPSRQLSR
jgi:hypothetical protein